MIVNAIDLEERGYIIIKFRDQEFLISGGDMTGEISITPVNGIGIHYRGFRFTTKEYENHIMKGLHIREVENDHQLRNIWEEYLSSDIGGKK